MKNKEKEMKGNDRHRKVGKRKEKERKCKKLDEK